MANKFVIEVRAKGFTNLNQQLNSADGAMKKFDNTGGKIRGTTSGIRREIGALRNNILLYTFAVGAAARTMSRFLTAASNMQESVSKFKVVFGDASDEALDFASSLASSFQRSEASIIALMASLQDTFVPLGFSRDEARKLSEALTQLSFDIGSFNNVASPEVAHALTSAIVGNHEAVRRFGIVLTEAQLKQEAFNTGIFRGTGEMNAQQKVLARVSVILNSTKDAQGDLIRTQHEFANQTRKVQEQLKDLQIEIGQLLMPMASMSLEFLKIERIKGYGLAILGVAGAYGVYRAQALLAAGATMTLKKALIKSGWGIAFIAIGEIASRTIFAKDATEDYTKSIKDLDKVMEDFVSDDDNNGLTYFQMMAHHLGKQGVRTLLDDIPPAVDKVKEKFDELTSRDKDMEELNETFEDTGNFMDEFFNEALAEQSEKAQESAESFHQLGVEIKKGDIARAEADIMRTANGMKGISDTAARAALHGKNMGDAFVLALRSIAMELAAQAASFAILNILTGGGLSASKAGFGLLGSILGHKGGAVTQKGVQTFSSGGIVGGGDNVPILAQAGEFIVKRDSAQSIGLDTLRQMNETGQPSSNIVVNIHGGVVQDDFIRNELIPAMNREGVRIARS
jgi:hypothetical protein